MIKIKRNEENSLVIELLLFNTMYMLLFRKSNALNKTIFNFIKISNYKKYLLLTKSIDYNYWNDYCKEMKKFQTENQKRFSYYF